ETLLLVRTAALRQRAGIGAASSARDVASTNGAIPDRHPHIRAPSAPQSVSPPHATHWSTATSRCGIGGARPRRPRICVLNIRYVLLPLHPYRPSCVSPLVHPRPAALRTSTNHFLSFSSSFFRSLPPCHPAPKIARKYAQRHWSARPPGARLSSVLDGCDTRGGRRTSTRPCSGRRSRLAPTCAPRAPGIPVAWNSRLRSSTSPTCERPARVLLPGVLLRTFARRLVHRHSPSLRYHTSLLYSPRLGSGYFDAADAH
ncbi:hypothetical protein C8J57DRAFT_1666855, partial [Mycena rebaudengoi]